MLRLAAPASAPKSRFPVLPDSGACAISCCIQSKSNKSRIDVEIATVPESDRVKRNLPANSNPSKANQCKQKTKSKAIPNQKQRKTKRSTQNPKKNTQGRTLSTFA